MKTKALLLAGILLATGVASTTAQVYSVNAVGYVSVTLAPGEFKIIGNPLNNVTNGVQSNTLNEILPNAPNNVVNIYRFSAGTQSYSLHTKRSSGWSNGGATVAINPGEGFFIQNTALTNITLTFVGEVPQGSSLSITVLGGTFNLVAPHVPIGGLVETDLGLPVTSANNSNAEQVYLYRGGAYQLFTRRLTWASGQQPSLNVGEGFFYRPNNLDATKQWTKSFTTSI